MDTTTTTNEKPTMPENASAIVLAQIEAMVERDGQNATMRAAIEVARQSIRLTRLDMFQRAECYGAAGLVEEAIVDVTSSSGLETALLLHDALTHAEYVQANSIGEREQIAAMIVSAGRADWSMFASAFCTLAALMGDTDTRGWLSLAPWCLPGSLHC